MIHYSGGVEPFPPNFRLRAEATSHNLDRILDAHICGHYSASTESEGNYLQLKMMGAGGSSQNTRLEFGEALSQVAGSGLQAAGSTLKHSSIQVI